MSCFSATDPIISRQRFKRGEILKVCVGLCLLAAALSVRADDTQDLIEATKIAVAAELKDPEAAQFKDVVVFKRSKSRVVCGEVNGKNGYGGYVGFRQFSKMENSPYVVIKQGDPIMDRLVDLACKPS